MLGAFCELKFGLWLSPSHDGVLRNLYKELFAKLLYMCIFLGGGSTDFIWFLPNSSKDRNYWGGHMSWTGDWLALETVILSYT